MQILHQVSLGSASFLNHQLTYSVVNQILRNQEMKTTRALQTFHSYFNVLSYFILIILSHLSYDSL